MLKYLFLLLISLNSWGIDIDCSSGTCTVDSYLPESIVNSGNYSSINMGLFNSPLNIDTEQNQAPYSLRLFYESGSSTGINIDLDLSSKDQNSDAANYILIGDWVNNISLKNNGYSGSAGKDASEICAENIKSGKYGQEVRDDFNTRRSGSSAIDVNRCDQIDLANLQVKKFQCDDPAYTEIPANDTTVQVTRIKPKARCQGFFRAKVCEKREVRLTCDYRVWNSGMYPRNEITNQVSNWTYGNANVTSPKFYTNRQSNIHNFTLTEVNYENTIDNLRLQGFNGTDNDLMKRYCHDNLPQYELSSVRKMLYHNGNSDFRNVAYSNHNFGGLTYEEKRECIGWSTIDQGIIDFWYSHILTPAYKYPDLVAGRHIPLSSDWGVLYYGDRWKSAVAYKDRYDGGAHAVDVCSWQPYSTSSQNLGVVDTVYVNGTDSCPNDYEESDIQYIVLTAYAENPEACYTVNHPDDFLNEAVWTFTGYNQLETFEDETVNCTIDNCPYTTNVASLPLSIEEIKPGDGTDGTKKGGGILFTYDNQSVSVENNQGIAGEGGDNDLNIPAEERVCVKVDDVSNSDRSSEFAKRPVISYRKYQWKALTSVKRGNSGVPPRNTDNEVKIFKKIDNSLRKLLKNELLQE
tara:strand:- start:2759 stop:4657 length:1899 start_codon:yes stop_codon:yes gene_type:complete